MGNCLENADPLSILDGMSKTLYINQTLNEYRAALVVRGNMTDFFMERGDGKASPGPVRSGNVYRGRIAKILPGIGAAFVDIGHDQAAYLYLDRRGEPLRPSLREGGSVLVQIYREPVGIKGAKLTRNIALVGRYLVYRPLSGKIGISRRIELSGERERLESILGGLSTGGGGLVARTYAEGKGASVLKAEFDALAGQWENIQHRYVELNAPGVCREEGHFVQKILRDIVDEEVADIWVDTPELKEMVEWYSERYLPWLVGKCHLYREHRPMLKKFGIEREVGRSLAGKIYLRSGGVVHIDQTEALVSIDVNTGRFVGKKSVEQTVLKTNLEAVGEIVRQLRLRNCGGIIVIDFIDMEDEDHRQQIVQAFNNALKRDRAKCRVLPLSRLGLVEMTRKQSKDTLARIVCEPCPYCEGRGRIKSATSVCYELLRDLRGALKERDGFGGGVSVRAHPDVVEQFCDSEGVGFMGSLQESQGRSFAFRADHHCHVEDYEIVFEKD